MAVTTLSLAVAMMALFAATVVRASDGDPLQDFCVADESSKIFINGFPCKDPAKVVSEDFTFRGLRHQGNLSTSFGAPLQKAFVHEFPGINTQGISWARLDFAYPAGLNVPHWHQRATEILSCQQGKLLVGFVDTNNKLWSTVLEPGDITTFPRGLMHFQLNVGKGPAFAVLALNSQNAGRSDVGASTFGAGVKEQILEKAFGLSEEAVKSLEKFFSMPHVQESSGVEVM
ncbi:hypothetical protein M758_9G110700 [Ceratodon purpureus]|nr:hypothetical protein M758_9G110700 [Ceratodon purpureus]